MTTTGECMVKSSSEIIFHTDCMKEKRLYFVSRDIRFYAIIAIKAGSRNFIATKDEASFTTANVGVYKREYEEPVGNGKQFSSFVLFYLSFLK